MRPFNFFADLPSSSPDAFRFLCKWLNIQGPHVLLIEGEPSLEQKAAVTAVAGPSLYYDEDKQSRHYVGLKEPESAVLSEANKKHAPVLAQSNEPDLSVYHLLVGYSDDSKSLIFRIGFCKKSVGGSLSYEIHPVTPQSGLLRYLQEDLQHPEFSQLFTCNRQEKTRQLWSENRLLLKLVESEIQTAGGLIHPHLRNRQRLGMVGKSTHAWMNGAAGREVMEKGEIKFKPYLPPFFKGLIKPGATIKDRFVEDALHHIAYGEESQAMNIINLDLSLLLSPNRASVTLCAPEMHCPAITLFELAILLGDWFLAKAIVKAIESSKILTESQKLGYKFDLLNQLEEVEENGCAVEFDNLLNKGVQILDADLLNDVSREHYKNDVVSRNAYHLMIQTFKENEKRTVISCVLGYRAWNPETEKYDYQEKEIFGDEELFHVVALELFEGLKNANNGHGMPHEHYFTRANRDLALVREILEKSGIKTRTSEMMKPTDFKKLQEYFEVRIQGFDNDRANWTNDRLREQWYGEIGAEMRLFSPVVWQFWLSDKNPWSLKDSEVDRFINSVSRPIGDKNYYNESIFPCSSSLGDRFLAWSGPAPRMLWPCASFIKIYLENRAARTSELKDVLAGRAGFDSTTSACSLM
jgi:hypothetical protein